MVNGERKKRDGESIAIFFVSEQLFDLQVVSKAEGVSIGKEHLPATKQIAHKNESFCSEARANIHTGTHIPTCNG